jgi:hypothetical protein
VLFLGGVAMINDDLQYMHELKIHQLESERMWWEDLMRHQWLSGDHKIILYTIRQIIKSLRYDWDQETCEPVLIWRHELESKTGLHENTISRCTNQLHEAGLIKKNTKREGKTSKSWYTLHGRICHSAKDIEIAAPGRNHGGLRITCRKCGGENLEAIAYKCLDCGHQWHL